MIVKSLTSVEIEITELMKRHQYITKLQGELIKEKKSIDHKLDEAIAKQCCLENTKYQLLPEVVIPTMTSDVKITKFDKTPNTTLCKTPVTPPSTPSKPVICNIQTKRPVSDAEKANMKKIQENVIYNCHDEIDDSQLLTAE